MKIIQGIARIQATRRREASAEFQYDRCMAFYLKAASDEAAAELSGDFDRARIARVSAPTFLANAIGWASR